MKENFLFYVLIAEFLFAIGFFGILFRRNLLIIFMCLELMLSASNLALVTFSRYNNVMDGSFFVFFIILVSASEVAVGLAILVQLFRYHKKISFSKNQSIEFFSTTDGSDPFSCAKLRDVP